MWYLIRMELRWLPTSISDGCRISYYIQRRFRIRAKFMAKFAVKKFIVTFNLAFVFGRRRICHFSRKHYFSPNLLDIPWNISLISPVLLLKPSVGCRFKLSTAFISTRTNFYMLAKTIKIWNESILCILPFSEIDLHDVINNQLFDWLGFKCPIRYWFYKIPGPKQPSDDK